MARRSAALGPTGYRPYSEQERDRAAARDRRRRRSRRPDRAARDSCRGGRAGDRHACRGGRGVPGGERHAAERDRRGGLPRPDGPAPAGTRAHGAARQWARACGAARHSRWSTTSAPPTSPPEGRAPRSCRCSTAPWCACSSARIPSACSISAASPTSPSSTARPISIAFDTGPGNALIDDFVRLRTGQPRDDDGRAAAAGTVDEAAVARVLAHPFFAKPPPKSLDRNAFRHWVAEEGRLAGKSTEDGAATLTAITAAAVARAITVLPRRAAELDRRRRRHAQSDPDADAGGAAGAGGRRNRRLPSAGRRMRWRRRPSPISRCAR